MYSSITDIFNELNNSKVLYCSWKSSEHLPESFACETDFDLFIDRNDSEIVADILKKYGMKRRVATAEKSYSLMEDYIGYLPDSGQLFHFHLHYKLILGAKYDKNYVVPVKDVIQKERVFSDEFGIWLSSPELEMLLLLIRIMLKTNFTLKNCVKLIIKRDLLPRNIRKEYDHLCKQVSSEKLRKLSIVTVDGKGTMVDIVTKFLDHRGYTQYFIARQSVKRIMTKFRIRTGREHRVERKARKLYSKIGVTYSSRSGVSIAFVGADGAGKSSGVETIRKWLSWKYSVRVLYMGIPKTGKILFVLKRLIRIANKLGLKKLSSAISDLRWIVIARSRVKLFVKAERLVNRGYVVIFDRFPFREFWDMKEAMDGPRIKGNARLAKYEKKCYENISTPDLTILMQVDLENSVKRKSEHENQKMQDMIQQKITALSILSESEGSDIEVVDTRRSHNEVLSQIKGIVWSYM